MDYENSRTEEDCLPEHRMELDEKSLNKKVVRSWSSSKRIVNSVDRVAHRIKQESGLQCDRSKLLNALVELLLEVEPALDTRLITNAHSLKHAVGKALKRRC